MTIFVTGSLSLENVIIDARDLHPDAIYDACYTSRSQCSLSFHNSGFNVTTGIYSEKFKDLAEEKLTFLAFQYLRDYDDAPIPSLTIDNCVIENFYYGQYYLSFILFDTFGGDLYIKNTEFSNFFFPLGLITNTGDLTLDRTFPFQSSYTNINCRKINPSIAGDCFSLTIEQSTFKYYNPKLALNDNFSNKFEGSVLELNNFDGKITISESSFE